MRSRKRRRYRKNKQLELHFSRYRNKFGYYAPHSYHAIELWLLRD